MSDLAWAEVAEISWLTLRVTLAATLAGAIVGVPLGAWIGVRARPTARVFRTLLYALYGLPPVVAGLLAYLLLSREGPLGRLSLLFTPSAIVVVEAMLAAPLIAGLTVAALAEVPRSVREAVVAAGAAPSRASWTLVKEARAGVAAALCVGFGRSLAEVAGALLVGGNIRGSTRTLGTAILQEVGEGDFALALRLAVVLLAIALLLVLLLAMIEATQPEDRP